MYLSDLTFMEDGNPDEVERNGKAVCNFQKHFMIHKAPSLPSPTVPLTRQTIDQLLRYQKSANYASLKRVEPVFTFVYELASLEENGLLSFGLSCCLIIRVVPSLLGPRTSWGCGERFRLRREVGNLREAIKSPCLFVDSSSLTLL